MRRAKFFSFLGFVLSLSGLSTVASAFTPPSQYQDTAFERITGATGSASGSCALFAGVNSLVLLNSQSQVATYPIEVSDYLRIMVVDESGSDTILHDTDLGPIDIPTDLTNGTRCGGGLVSDVVLSPQFAYTNVNANVPSFCVTFSATEQYSVSYEFANDGGLVIPRINVQTGCSNQTPTADAGPDQVAEYSDTVQLSGSGTDVDGTISGYRWTNLTGVFCPEPSDTEISNPQVTHGFLPNFGEEPWDYQDLVCDYGLVVTDNDGAQSTNVATTTVTWEPPAFEWPEQRIETVVFENGQSFGSRNSGCEVTASLTYPNELPFETILVTDLSNGDQVVHRDYGGSPVASTLIVQNGTPCGDAVIEDVNLNPIPDLNIPAALEFCLVHPDARNNLLVEAKLDYDYVPSVTYSNGCPGRAVNLAPTAQVGPGQSVNNGQTVTLQGAGADTDGTVVGYQWNNDTGGQCPTPSPSDVASPQLTYSALVAGDQNLECEYSLVVTDNDGAQSTNSAVTTVTWIAPSFQDWAAVDILDGVVDDLDVAIDPPGQNCFVFATIAADQNNVLTGVGVATGGDYGNPLHTQVLTPSGPGTTATLTDGQQCGDGVVSDVQVTAPSGVFGNGTNPALSFCLENSDPGKNVFVQAGFSGQGLNAEPFVTTSSVCPALVPNEEPVADAGANQLVNNGASVTLQGVGTDNDGTVVGYQWNNITGGGLCPDPTPNNISNPVLTVSSLVPGDNDLVCNYSLIVTDDDGAVSTNATQTQVTWLAPQISLQEWVNVFDGQATYTNGPGANCAIGAGVVAVPSNILTGVAVVTNGDVGATLHNQMLRDSGPDLVATLTEGTACGDGAVTNLQVTAPSGDFYFGTNPEVSFCLVNPDPVKNVQVRAYIVGSGLNAVPKVDATAGCSNTQIDLVPVADAGSDISTAGDGIGIVTLDGLGSSDPEDGNNITYLWTGASGNDPSCPAISNPTVVQPQLTAAPDIDSPMADLSCQYELIVTDTAGQASPTSTVTVTYLVDDDDNGVANINEIPDAPYNLNYSVDPNGIVTVTGQATPGDTVVIQFPDGTVRRVVVPANGVLTATSENSFPGGIVQFYAEDADGDRSIVVNLAISTAWMIQPTTTALENMIAARVNLLAATKPNFTDMVDYTANCEGGQTFEGLVKDILMTAGQQAAQQFASAWAGQRDGQTLYETIMNPDGSMSYRTCVASGLSLWTKVAVSLALDLEERGSTIVGTAGFTYSVSKDLAVGATLVLDGSEWQQSRSTASAQGSSLGWMVSPYLAFQNDSGLSGHLSIGIGQANGQFAPFGNRFAALSDAYEDVTTDRFEFSGSLSGTVQLNPQFKISPRVNVEYWREASRAFTDRYGNAIPTVAYARFDATVGARLEATMPANTAGQWDTTAWIAGDVGYSAAGFGIMDPAATARISAGVDIEDHASGVGVSLSAYCQVAGEDSTVCGGTGMLSVAF